MIFTLEPLQAAEGDCLLLHWGSADDPKLAVIDGGPGRIYENSLRPRLEQLAQRRGMTPLPIDLAMVSHMDSDHIVGVRKLFAEIVSEMDAHVPPAQRFAKVNRLWLNAFNDILGDAVDAYYKRLTASYEASIAGEPNPALVDELATAFGTRHGLARVDAEFEAEAVGALLAGYADGRDLRDHHAFLRKRNAISAMNSPFHSPSGKATLLTSEKTAERTPVDGLDVQIVAPAQAQIDALQKEFDAYIKKNGLAVEAVLAAYADVSAKNLSSIVCIVSVDVGTATRTILLTGDARGDHILEGLDQAGLTDKDGHVALDVLKVPHHGSDRNVEPEFFARVWANHYVFSGNGKHGNPDRATMEWLLDARGRGTDYTVYLTYDIQGTDEQRRIEHEKKPERGPWREQEHSLQAMIDQRRADGYRFHLLAGAPFRIDLGDDAAAD